MNRLFIILGIGLVLAGLLWPWLRQLPLGRLPGDLHISRESFQLYFPLTTSIIVSVLLSLLLWLLKK
ncbi:MAG: DUF2905 domain-containing protein [Desulfobulbaceae bacterium]|nr:DUF2905 domain-containing protein [Desulfobulbaceae bacterium]